MTQISLHIVETSEISSESYSAAIIKCENNPANSTLEAVWSIMLNQVVLENLHCFVNVSPFVDV